MSNPIPETMQAIRLEEENGKLQVRQIPVPKPGTGEVLIRMAASTINPSDIGFMYSTTGYSNRVLPVTPGLEGSGTVVDAGAGFLPNYLKGKRVACSKDPNGNGTWAEYAVTKSALCILLQKQVTLEQGATLVVNPMTAVIFFEIIKQGKHRAFVNTAAASQLGRMLLRMAQKRNIPIINVVRRKDQADVLRSLGAEHVLVSTDADFDQNLSALSHRLNATLILDAICGEFTQRLVDASPPNSLILLYSNLSVSPAQMMPHSLWIHNRRVEGFYLGTWASQHGILKLLSVAQQVQKLMSTDLQVTFQKRIPFALAQEALELYQNNMTAGKILLVIDPNAVPLS